jgi:hypothetical protein
MMGWLLYSVAAQGPGWVITTTTVLAATGLMEGLDQAAEVQALVEDVYEGVEAFVVVGSSTGVVEQQLGYAAAAVGCVVAAGVVSGLTLGLLSLSPLSMQILARTGTDEQRCQVSRVQPLLQSGHQLLVTLLLCNALALEALPIFLDHMGMSSVQVTLGPDHADSAHPCHDVMSARDIHTTTAQAAAVARCSHIHG